MFLGYVVVVVHSINNNWNFLLNSFITFLSFNSQQTNSRWRVIKWFQMPISTNGGNDSCAPGSTSQPASIADVKTASRKPRLFSHAQLLVHCVPLWDAHRSAITQSCVPAADSHWLNWRQVLLNFNYSLFNFLVCFSGFRPHCWICPHRWNRCRQASP